MILLLVLVAVIPFAAGARVGGGDVTMGNEYGPVTFSHEKHAAKSLSCEQCHPDLYETTEKHKIVTMAEMETGLSCGKCHNGKPVFSVNKNCNTCHKK